MDKTLDTYPSCEQCRHRKPMFPESDLDLDLCASEAVMLEYMYNPRLLKFREIAQEVCCDVERKFGFDYSACGVEGKYFEVKG